MSLSDRGASKWCADAREGRRARSESTAPSLRHVMAGRVPGGEAVCSETTARFSAAQSGFKGRPLGALQD